MADAAVSKTAEGNLVRVRLPLSAPEIRIQIDRIVLWEVPKPAGTGGRLTAVLTAVALTCQQNTGVWPVVQASWPGIDNVQACRSDTSGW